MPHLHPAEPNAYSGRVGISHTLRWARDSPPCHASFLCWPQFPHVNNSGTVLDGPSGPASQAGWGIPESLTRRLPLSSEVADGLCCVLTTPCLTQSTAAPAVRAPDSPVTLRQKTFDWKRVARWGVYVCVCVCPT